MQKLIWSVFTLSTALAADPCRAVDWLDFGGYVNSYVVVIDQAEFTNQDEVGERGYIWANNNRARANVAVTIADWLDLDVSYDLSLRFQDDDLFAANPFLVFQVLSIYRIDDLNPLIWPDNPGEGDHVAIYHNLDRLYFTARASWFDLFVGRQTIAWGSAHAVNPTDILAPFLYNEIDTVDRIGIDAVRLRVPAGSLGEVDVGYVAGEEFKWSNSAAYLRGKFYAARTDFALIAMAFRENAMAAFDVTRAIGGAGAWCEAAYVWANTFDDRDAVGAENDYLRLSAGADYNFGSGVYAFVEYHFNGAGVSDPNEYYENITTNTTAFADGAVYLFGRHYIIPGVSWTLSPLTTLFAEVLANLDDGSALIAPILEYNATDNLYLSAGAYAAIGDNPTALPVPPGSTADDAAYTPLFNSEFGAYPSQYFGFLRYYY